MKEQLYRMPFLILKRLTGSQKAVVVDVGEILKKLFSPNYYHKYKITRWPMSITREEVRALFISVHNANGEKVPAEKVRSVIISQLNLNGFQSYASKYEKIADFETMLDAFLSDAYSDEYSDGGAVAFYRLDGKDDEGKIGIEKYVENLNSYISNDRNLKIYVEDIFCRLCFEYSLKGQMQFTSYNLAAFAPSSPLFQFDEDECKNILLSLSLIEKDEFILRFKSRNVRDFFCWMNIVKTWNRQDYHDNLLQLTEFKAEISVFELTFTSLFKAASPVELEELGILEEATRLLDFNHSRDMLPLLTVSLARYFLNKENNRDEAKKHICKLFLPSIDNIVNFYGSCQSDLTKKNWLNMEYYLKALLLQSEMYRRLSRFDESRASSEKILALSTNREFTETARNNIAKCLLYEYTEKINSLSLCEAKPSEGEIEKIAEDFKTAFEALKNASKESFLSKNLFAFLLSTPDPVSESIMDRLKISHDKTQAFSAFCEAAADGVKRHKRDFYAEEKAAFMLVRGEVAVNAPFDISFVQLVPLLKKEGILQMGIRGKPDNTSLKLAEAIFASIKKSGYIKQSTIYLGGLISFQKQDDDLAIAAFKQCSFRNSKLYTLLFDTLSFESMIRYKVDSYGKIDIPDDVKKNIKALSDEFDSVSEDFKILPIRIDSLNPYYALVEAADILHDKTFDRLVVREPFDKKAVYPLRGLAEAIMKAARKANEARKELYDFWS